MSISTYFLKHFLLVLKVMLFLFCSVQIRSEIRIHVEHLRRGYAAFIKQYVRVSDTLDRDCVNVMMVVEIPVHQYVAWSNVLDTFAGGTLSISMNEDLCYRQSFHLVYRYCLRTAHGNRLASMERIGLPQFLREISFDRKMLQNEIEIRKGDREKEIVLELIPQILMRGYIFTQCRITRERHIVPFTDILFIFWI